MNDFTNRKVFPSACYLAGLLGTIHLQALLHDNVAIDLIELLLVHKLVDDLDQIVELKMQHKTQHYLEKKLKSAYTYTHPYFKYKHTEKKFA